LKNEYHSHFDKVNELKEQLSKYIDTSALKLPKAVEYPGENLSLFLRPHLVGVFSDDLQEE